jgi:uncharacterized membrane protein
MMSVATSSQKAVPSSMFTVVVVAIIIYLHFNRKQDLYAKSMKEKRSKLVWVGEE